MAYPFKTHQRNVPSEKAEIYTASRQELIFSATVCNQSAETGTISLWTRIGGVESPVEFQKPVPGTNSADNRAIAVALNKISLENGDAILAAGGASTISGYGEASTTNYGEASTTNYGEIATGGGTASGSSANLTLTISILY